MLTIILAAVALAPPSLQSSPSTQGPASETTTLAPLFQEGVVLQRNVPIRIWGRSEPGRDLEASLRPGGPTATGRADASGTFHLTLAAQPAGGPFRLHVDDVAIDDVLVGDVWLCSGQSNMEYPMRAFEDCKAAIARSADERLRLFVVPRTRATEPARTCGGAWRRSDPEAVAGFSAVGWHFGQQLRDLHPDVPVGLVQAAWGGTRAEAWTRPEALAEHATLRPILERWQAEPKAVESPQVPGVLYHGMIAPLAPFRLRGVLWYQGESNWPRGAQYAELFATLIADWREQFGQGDLPFLFVELAGFAHVQHFAEIRDAQARVARTVRRVGMASAVDLGNPDDIHPQRKREVARRLLLAARRLAYGETESAWRGPTLRSVEAPVAGRVRLRFDTHGSALRPATGLEPDALTGFVVAGRDRAFVPAQARIVDPNTIEVHSDAVAEPVAVRYGWESCPELSVFDSEGLPVSPFRTDSWPGATAGRWRPR